MRVLIVDQGRERSSVVAARALAARGWIVGAGSASPSLAARTRAVSAWHHIANVDETDERFLESLDEVVAAHRYDAVFVGWEAAVAAVSEHRDRLGFPVGYGPHDGVRRAMDKEQLALSAAGAGLNVPRTVHASAETIEGLGAAIIVKPASPADAAFAAKAFTDGREALRFAATIEAAGGRAIAQEKLEGGLIAVSLVAGPAGIVSIAQQRAVHVWPEPVGVTARGVTVPVDPDLRAGIERLLAELEWQGLAQLQFLVTADGRPHLLDFNPRLYGSLALAVRAGANHPDVWARIATGQPVTAVTGRPGASFQWFSRDMRATLASPQRPRELARFAYHAATATHSLWSWSEPLLAPSFLAAQAGRALKRRAGPPTSTPAAPSTPTPESAPAPAPPSEGGTPAIREAQPGKAEDAPRSARLNGLAPTPEVLKALRTRRIPRAPERTLQRILMKAGALSYERSWLAPLQQARRAASAEDAGGPRFLVRVDEFPYYSGFDDEKYGFEASRRFHAVMAEERVPHLMSVLPQWTHEPLRPDGSGGRALDERDRQLLEQMRADGVTFAQHGDTHRTRHTDPRRQSELCGLGPAELGELLDSGRRKLAAVGVEPRILVPPFNRFDAAQWPVLEQRYDLITGGPESVMLMGFHGGPQWRGAAVYLPCYAPLYESAAVVERAVQEILDSGAGGWIPIVLHMGWEVDDDFAALRRLARRVAPHAAPWEDLLASLDASRAA